MKDKTVYIFYILSTTFMFVLITTMNSSLSSIFQYPVYASTQQVTDESETSQEIADSEQSDSGVNNTEAVDSKDQPRVQQPPQIDTISPNVLSVTPNYGTSGIPVTTTITVKFSEPIKASTVNPTTFNLESENNNKVQGSTSLSSDGTTAIFTPSSVLSRFTVYTASISEVKDLAGNTMNFASPWSFTTEGQAGPPSQEQPPQQPSPSTSTPSSPGGGGNSGGSGSGGILGDIKTSPTEKDVLKDAAQYVEDEKLVDRILPIIISKMDKKQLAATVLPYLDLQLSVRQVDGETKTAQGSELKRIYAKASCSPEEILIGGGFNADGATKITGSIIQGNQWTVDSTHSPEFSAQGTDGSITGSYAICLKAELVPKDPNAPTLTNDGP
jgi:hypothetical protein